MNEQITRWSVGEKFTEALTEAVEKRETVEKIMKPVGDAMEEAFASLCDEIRDRMADVLNDEVRARVDKIIDALLTGDERLLGTYIAVGGYREPNVGWDGSFRSGYWVEVRRKITEANERILTSERVADLTAERDALAEKLKEKASEAGRLRGELAEVKEALHWANVRLERATPETPA